jgi:hypothetical protein
VFQLLPPKFFGLNYIKAETAKWVMPPRQQAIH